MRARFLFHGTNCKKRRRCETDTLDKKQRQRVVFFLRNLPPLLTGDEYAQLNLSVETKPHCLVPGEPLPIIAPGYHLTYPFRRQILPPILKNITRIFQKTIPLKKDVSYFHNFSQHSFLLQSNFFSSRNWNHLKKILKYEKSICNSYSVSLDCIVFILCLKSDIRNYAK